MVALDYDTNNASRAPSTPAGVGNLVYDAVPLWFSNDGSRQTNGTPYNPASSGTLPIAYPDYPTSLGGYVYMNPPLATSFPGITDGQDPPQTVVDINRWQRLRIVNA